MGKGGRTAGMRLRLQRRDLRPHVRRAVTASLLVLVKPSIWPGWSITFCVTCYDVLPTLTVFGFQMTVSPPNSSVPCAHIHLSVGL